VAALVTVVIPTCNHAHFLPHAVRSVLAQTFTDWEAIIVDDGSTDNTTAVVVQFADSRIRYIHQANRGLAAARNTGVVAARGDYLAFLDADDQWESTFLERCVGVLNADGDIAGVYTRNRFVDGDGIVLPQLGGHVVAPGRFRDKLLEGGFFPPCAALVRAEAVSQTGMFDVGLSATEDWDLWLRVSEHRVMRGVAEPLALYRISPGSMSSDSLRMHANRTAVLAKHFGPPDGDPSEWSETKRHAYGFAYRCVALQFIEQARPDEGWDYLARAVSIWPNLLARPDTFYELACGDQAKGYRGQADLLDVGRNGADLLTRLDDLFAKAGTTLESRRRAAHGSAYLALAMLSDQARRWDEARRYLFKAVGINPMLLLSYPVVRRLCKLCAGPRLVYLGRLLTNSSQPTA
jgi:tetratricopeptide (TPR) repeat protein